MKAKSRKIFIIAVCLLVVALLFCFGCSKDGGSGSGGGDVGNVGGNGGGSQGGNGGSGVGSGNNGGTPDIIYSPDYYLGLNSTRLTLGAGDTFTLTAKLVNADGSEKDPEEVKFASESPKIAEVSDSGTVKALRNGGAYIIVTAGNLSAACFVTVSGEAGQSGIDAKIFLRDETLYEGIPMQASVFVYRDGERTDADLQVTWSVSDTQKCAVSADGVLTPAASSGEVTVYAQFTYEGQNFSLEKKATLSDLAYYKATLSGIKLATAKTVSGANNTVFTTRNFSVKKLNAKTGTQSDVPYADYSVTLDGDSVKAEADGANECKVTALKAGATTLSISSDKFAFTVSAEVATAVSSVNDMDTLALASYNNTALLAGDYILTDDIDYNGTVIYPIACFRETKSQVAGVQWKYVLQRSGNNWSFVNRANVNASSGLSNANFTSFVSGGGINPDQVAFTGTFDGNGWAVKNAKIMFGPYTLNSASLEGHISAYMNIFGIVRGSVINTGFENISLQDPKDYPYIDAIADSSDKLHKQEFSSEYSEYIGRGFAVVGRAIGATIRNLFVSATYNISGIGIENSVIMEYGSGGVTLTNCVADLTVTSKSSIATGTTAFGGAGVANPGNVSNNIAIGVWHGHTSLRAGKHEGQNGNWWCESHDAGDLFTTRTGSEATNVKSVFDVADTFDSSVWSIEHFNNIDRELPHLLQGCSVA